MAILCTYVETQNQDVNMEAEIIGCLRIAVKKFHITFGS